MVADEFQPDHHPLSAHIANQRLLLGQPAQTVAEIVAQLTTFIDEMAPLDFIQ